MDIYYPSDWKSGARIPAVVFVSGYSDVGFQKMLGCKLKEMGSYISWGQLTAASGMKDTHGKALVVAFADVNGDGKPDFYIGNDGTPADLMINQGHLRFKNAGISQELVKEIQSRVPFINKGLSKRNPATGAVEDATEESRIAGFIHGHSEAARTEAALERIAAIAAMQNTAAAAPRAVPLSIRRNASPDPSRIC